MEYGLRGFRKWRTDLSLSPIRVVRGLFSPIQRPELPHHPRMSETVSARLRPYRQAMWFRSYRDRLYCSACRIDRVNDPVESSGKPQEFAVGADIAHVRTSAAWDRPGLFDLMSGEINYGHAPGSVRCSLAH